MLRELLGQLIKEVLDQKDLVLNTGPVDVYRAWINNMETQTGEATYVYLASVLNISITC